MTDGGVRKALTGQYRASLRMLRQAIERCPDHLWNSGTHPRNFWRIAYHAIFYADLYVVQNEAAFTRWEKHSEGSTDLWPEANAPVIEPYTKEDLMAYIDRLVEKSESTFMDLDLDTDDPGYYWYKGMTKLEHEILNIRHIQGHVGQLSELLMANGIDTDWIARGWPSS